MLRIVNIARNVGGNLLRSGVREDRPKTSLAPPSQFLFWFNEVPGQFTPAPRLTSAASLPTSWSGGSNTGTRDLANYAEFTHHNEENGGFCFENNLSYLRAVQCSAILAVSYSILHDKQLSRFIKESFQLVSFDSILQSHCPVLSIKNQKTVHAQPVNEKSPKYLTVNDCKEQYQDQELKTNVEEAFLSTSDYSSHKSESDSCSLSPFTQEEDKLLKIEKLVPDNVNEVMECIQKVREGDKDAFNSMLNLSSTGCFLAQFYLGQMYENGILTEKNLKKASELYLFAANGGIAEAKFNLGLLYLNGSIEEMDENSNYHRGMSLIQEAASDGIVEAKEMLGIEPKQSMVPKLSFEIQEELFKTGLILEENNVCDENDEWFALDFYRLAAEAGHQESKNRFNKLISKK